jgi:hypothetical protein
MAKRGRKPQGIHDKNIYNRLVILWQIGFFCHTPLMAKDIKKSVSALRKYLDGTNAIPYEVIEKYKLDDEGFWDVLDGFGMFFGWFWDVFE